MNNSAKSNMYEVNAASVLDAFGAFVQGTPEATVLTISTQPASDTARKAIKSSVDQLGYNRDACAWIVTTVDDLTLGPQEVGTIVEGVDPLSVICLDEAAATLFGQAYRAELPLDAVARVKGRTVAAFAQFEALLDDSDSKQKAWALLKKLRVGRS